MKNKLIIIFLGCLFLNNISLAETFKFETSSIDITENGNLIYAKNGKAISSDGELEIHSKKFEYKKDLNLLQTFGGGFAFIKSKNLKIEFENSIIDQKNLTIKAFGDVKVYKVDKKIIIKTNTIDFNRKDNLIKSETKTILTDDDENIYNVDNFIFEIENDLLKIENANFKDKNNNRFYTSLAFINTKTNKLFGKDVSVNLSNDTFEKNNEPRLKGNSVTNDDRITEITKGVFTTCKKREKCPPWQLSAKKITHDKEKQIINYDSALLKVYDTPVMYFPKFFHPDPTVKRRSGFLIPSVKNSQSSDNYLNTPYFFAIAENKDATFSPRFFTEQKILLQTEYRQKNKNSKHISDFSFFTEKNKNSKSHFFYEYFREYETPSFEETIVDLKIQQSSNDTYLKANKLESNLMPDSDVLENTFGLNLYSNDLSINTEVTIYENLNEENSDRFEYIFPKFDLVKKIENKTNFNGDFSFKSQGIVRNYDTNIHEKININDFIFNSNPSITKNGFYNNFNLILKNSNTDTQKSSKFKEGENYYISSLFQFNTSLPLIKENDNYQKILKPKMSLKIAPNNSKNLSNSYPRIDVNNIYSLNRISEDDVIEGGVSVAYGNDFTVFDKEDKKEIFSLKLANNLRIEENNDLPQNNQIGQKTSNFFSEISYSPNNVISTKYNTSIKNNLSDINYENLIAEFRLNNIVTTFDYLNENDTKDKNSYLTNTTMFEIDEFNSLSFSTRENKKLNLTEYYKLIYQYKNDCLAASVEYNKDFYSDRDLQPEENIFFKLTIIPFGETSSPNLKN